MSNSYIPIDECIGAIDNAGWLYILAPDGPRLNFMPTSMIRLRNFLHDADQENAVISESYHVERSHDGMILHVMSSHSYRLSANAEKGLRELLNKR